MSGGPRHLQRQGSIFDFHLEEQSKHKKSLNEQASSAQTQNDFKLLESKILRFYTEEALDIRSKLRFHADIEERMEKFWVIYRRDHEGRLFRGPYLRIHQLLAQVFVPSWTAKTAFRVALRDWNHDTKHYSCRLHDGTPYLDIVTYFDSLFELVDIWIDTIELRDYIAKLDEMYAKLTQRLKDAGISVPKPTALELETEGKGTGGGLAHDPSQVKTISRFSKDFTPRPMSDDLLGDDDMMSDESESLGGIIDVQNVQRPEDQDSVPDEHLQQRIAAMSSPSLRSKASAVKWEEVAKIVSMANVAAPVTFKPPPAKRDDVIKDRGKEAVDGNEDEEEKVKIDERTNEKTEVEKTSTIETTTQGDSLSPREDKANSVVKTMDGDDVSRPTEKPTETQIVEKHTTKKKKKKKQEVKKKIKMSEPSARTEKHPAVDPQGRLKSRFSGLSIDVIEEEEDVPIGKHSTSTSKPNPNSWVSSSHNNGRRFTNALLLAKSGHSTSVVHGEIERRSFRSPNPEAQHVLNSMANSMRKKQQELRRPVPIVHSTPSSIKDIVRPRSRHSKPVNKDVGTLTEVNHRGDANWYDLGIRASKGLDRSTRTNHTNTTSILTQFSKMRELLDRMKDENAESQANHEKMIREFQRQREHTDSVVSSRDSFATTVTDLSRLRAKATNTTGTAITKAILSNGSAVHANQMARVHAIHEYAEEIKRMTAGSASSKTPETSTSCDLDSTNEIMLQESSELPCSGVTQKTEKESTPTRLRTLTSLDSVNGIVSNEQRGRSNLNVVTYTTLDSFPDLSSSNKHLLPFYEGEGSRSKLQSLTGRSRKHALTQRQQHSSALITPTSSIVESTSSLSKRLRNIPPSTTAANSRYSTARYLQLQNLYTKDIYFGSSEGNRRPTSKKRFQQQRHKLISTLPFSRSDSQKISSPGKIFSLSSVASINCVEDGVEEQRSKSERNPAKSSRMGKRDSIRNRCRRTRPATAPTRIINSTTLATSSRANLESGSASTTSYAKRKSKKQHSARPSVAMKETRNSRLIRAARKITKTVAREKARCSDFRRYPEKVSTPRVSLPFSSENMVASWRRSKKSGMVPQHHSQELPVQNEVRDNLMAEGEKEAGEFAYSSRLYARIQPLQARLITLDDSFRMPPTAAACGTSSKAVPSQRNRLSCRRSRKVHSKLN